MPITVRIQTGSPTTAYLRICRTCLRLAANGRSIEGNSPVEAFIVDVIRTRRSILSCLSIGGFEQAVGVFEIGAGQMADDFQRAEIVAVGVDAAYGRNGPLSLAWAVCSSQKQTTCFWNNPNPLPVPGKRL